jgi:hypothetical protein
VVAAPESFPGKILIALSKLDEIRWQQMYTDPASQKIILEKTNYEVGEDRLQGVDLPPIKMRAYSPDNKKTLYVTEDCQVEVYDLEARQTTRVLTLPRGEYAPENLPGAKSLVCGGVTWENPWIDNDRLYLNAFLGSMPFEVNPGGPAPDTAIMATLGEELILEKGPLELGRYFYIDRCTDTPGLLWKGLPERSPSGKRGKYSISPEAESLSQIDPGQVFEGVYIGKLENPCRFYFLKRNDTFQYDLYRLDPPIGAQTKELSFKLPDNANYILDADYVYWLGDPDNHQVLVVDSLQDKLMLVDMNTGGATCLLGQTGKCLYYLADVNDEIHEVLVEP